MSVKVDDIITEDNHRALRIDKSKTQAGTRTVPLHPAITDLVDRLAADSKDGYLVFSKSKNQYDERSTGLSRRFGRLKSSLGYGPELVFHSLRKTVTTKLEQAGVSEGHCCRHSRARKADHNLWSLLRWNVYGAEDGSHQQYHLLSMTK